MGTLLQLWHTRCRHMFKSLILQHRLSCRLYISQHPEVEAKIVQELQVVGVCASTKGAPTRRLTPADLQKLSYLKCVIKVRDTYPLAGP